MVIIFLFNVIIKLGSKDLWFGMDDEVTIQDVFMTTPSFFLRNNGGYTIEVEIHDDPYNIIKNWNYKGFMEAIHNGEGKCWTSKVRCVEKLKHAIEQATNYKDCLCFIEAIVHKDDMNKDSFWNGILNSRQQIAGHLTHSEPQISL